MAKTLELQFITQLGKSAVISIDSPKVPINPAKVNEAMDKILQANLFVTSSGEFVSKKAANLVERNVQEFDMK